MTWLQRIQDIGMRHKKKLIFLGVVSSVLQYYNMFHRMSAWYKSREPGIKKLQRWILGVKNIPLLSITQNREDSDVRFLRNGDFEYNGVPVSRGQHDRLCEAFMHMDQKLFFGVTFRFLSILFKRMNILESRSEEQRQMYNLSGYQRKINRKCCGVNLKEFVSIVVSKKPGDLPMEQWIESVVSEMQGLESNQVAWEAKYIPMRIELIKMFSSIKGEKKEFIANLLIDNPFMRIEKLGRDGNFQRRCASGGTTGWPFMIRFSSFRIKGLC